MDEYKDKIRDLHAEEGENIIRDMVNDSIELGQDFPVEDEDHDDIHNEDDDYDEDEYYETIPRDCISYDTDDSDDRVTRLYKKIYSIKYDDGYKLFDAGSMCELTDEAYMYIKRIEGTNIVMLGTFEGPNSDSIFSLREKTAPCKLYNLDTRKFIIDKPIDKAYPLSKSVVIVSNEDKQRLFNVSTGEYIGGEERVFKTIKHLSDNIYLVTTDTESYHLYDADNDSLVRVENKDKLMKIVSDKGDESEVILSESVQKASIQPTKSPSIKCGNNVKQSGYKSSDIKITDNTSVVINNKDDSHSLIVTTRISDDIYFIYNTSEKLGRLIDPSTMELLIDKDIQDVVVLRGDLAKIKLDDDTWEFFDLKELDEIKLDGYNDITSIRELDRFLYIIDNTDSKFLIRFIRDEEGLCITDSVRLL